MPAIDGPPNSTFSVHGSLTCTQALKVLNQRGKVNGKFEPATASCT